jgi:hypothetical protein
MQPSRRAVYDFSSEVAMSILKNISRTAFCLAVALSAPLGYAADIDIYARPPVTTSDPSLNPNVLIVIDNSANWAAANQHWPGGIKQGQAELNSLLTVIGELGPEINVGLMMFTPGTGSNHNGGYIRYAMRQMTATNKSAFSELIGYSTGCTPGTNSLNGTPNCIYQNFNGSEKVSAAQTDYSAAMLDVFKYFGGYTWPAHAQDDVAGANINSSQFGTRRYAGDFTTSGTAKFDPAAYSDSDKDRYNSPLSALNNCAKNYVIFIGNGFPSQDSPSTLLGPPSLLPTQGVGGDVTQLPVANLATSTTTSSVLLATPACGTYPGADATASLAACNKKVGGTFTVTLASPAVFSKTAHGFSAGDPVTISTTGSLPTGLATSTTYYVSSTGLTADSFQLQASGGAVVNTSGTQSGTHTVSNLAALYPGYSSYNCTSANVCSAGSTTTTTTNLGDSSCIQFASQSACQSALPTLFPGYTSYSCSAGTACSSSSSNPSNPVVAATACISDNLNNASNCTAYGNTNYPSYSGFSCTSVANCGSSGKQWRIDATTQISTGNTYTMSGITTSTVFATTYSQYINATSTTIAATPDGTFSAPSKINNFDEWARFLYQTDVSSAAGKQNINTFTIDVFKDQQDVNESQLLISAAQAGGGKYFQAKDQNAITNALRKIFSEIQSVNSVFASSSLPVSVNTQGTYLNQVFMGMFRPDGTASPRWPGNLKQYQFKLFNGVLKLADKNGSDAISTTTGFVTPCATSFWSTDTGQYWNYGGATALGDCTAVTSAFPVAGSTAVFSDAPDGEVVEKGGASQRLRGVYSSGGTLVSSSMNYQLCTGAQTPATDQCRMLKTCDGSSSTSCTAFTSFDTSNTSINATTLNITDATQVNNLINWTRGQDVDNENANLDASLVPITNEMRPSVHGGVVHSQPAVIDYGGSIGTVAFYGADDGVFHAVDGNQTDTSGYELWGFIAPEFYSKLNRLRTNSPAIAYPGVTGSPAPQPKDYFFDGSIGVYQNTAAGQIWIYPSMRRGGRAIYAFDVSTPSSPVLKWRKGCFTNDTTNDSVCSTGWSGIGQTWSNPHITYLNGYVDGSSVQKPVLVFGGGYDQCEDTDSQTRCTTTPRKGANIWFVDADTGAILRTYPTNYSVAGDVALVKDSNGNLTHVYATDTGGNVYRIDVGMIDTTGTTFTSWTDNTAASNILLASLSETNQARKFLYGPAVVQTANYNALLVGSGDREHPLVTDYACTDYSTVTGSYVTNQFYMLIDKPNVYPSPALTPSSLVDVTTGTTTSATVSGVTTITNSVGPSSSTHGWRFNYGPCEQTVNEALTIAGVTYFGTNAPSATSGGSCTANLGTANGYAVDFLTGNPDNSVRSAAYVGGGMPPSPVAGVVEVDGVKYPFCIGCIDTTAANASALQGSKVTINPTGSRYRAYWYREGD